MALTDKLKALADVIREKTGYEGTMTLDEMVNVLRGTNLIVDNTVAYILVDENGNEVTAVMVEAETDLTATANDIRLGTTAVTVDGITEGKLIVPK